MSSHYIVPTFNKSTPNKLHKDLVVTDQNTVSRPTGNSWEAISAIATEFIPGTVDGEYIFAVRIDDIGNAGIMIGVTSMHTFDSNKPSCPGWNGMTGCALDLYTGNYVPGDKRNLIDPKITSNAKKVIVVVTVSPGIIFGHNIFIRYSVDGNFSANINCTEHCGGKKIFPLICLFEENQQFATIPIDEITIRNDEVRKLVEKCMQRPSTSTNLNATVVANINQQQPSSPSLDQSHASFVTDKLDQSSSGTQIVAESPKKQQKPSTDVVAQLQQELEKERKRADLAESQLQLEKQHHEEERQNSLLKDRQLQFKDQQLMDKDRDLLIEKKSTFLLEQQVAQDRVADLLKRDENQQQKLDNERQQQELERERQRADLAEAQLQEKDQQQDKERHSSLSNDQLLQQKDQQLQDFRLSLDSN